MSTEARTLTPEQFEYLNVTKAQARDREEALRQAARETRLLVQTIRTHIHMRNYGLAEDWCDELLGKLPHDHGAQEFYPLYDEQLDVAHNT